MGLTDLKFTETDFLNKKIADLSDTPNSDGMSAAELKAYFDYIPKTLIALTRLNSIIDIISGSSGAENVGASTITGVTGTTAQAMLESLKSLIDLRYTKNETDNLLSFKATNETVSQLIKNVDFDEDTGKFTFTFESGNTKEIDTAMEKIAVNFSYDPDTQSLVLEYVDGTTETISLAEFITNNEFEDSNTIDFTVTEGIVKAEIKLGSITDDMLSSALLTALAGYVSSAAGSAQEAASSETNAGTYEQAASAAAQTATQKAKNAADSALEASSNANKSKSYAVGGTGTRTGEDTDNAQYYSEQANLRANDAQASAKAAEEAKEQAEAIVGGDFATRATPAKVGNLAALTAEGNLSDSGKTADELDNIFIATYGTTTNAEIEAALSAGKLVVAHRNKRVYALIANRVSETWHMFSYVIGRANYQMWCNDDSWSIITTKYAGITKGEVTLTTSGWTADGDEFIQTKNLIDTPATGYIYSVYPNSDQYKAWCEAGIYAEDVTVANKITFRCSIKPSVDIVANVKKEEVTS